MPNTLFHLQFTFAAPAADLTLIDALVSTDGWRKTKQGSGNMMLDETGFLIESAGYSGAGYYCYREPSLFHDLLTWDKNRTFKARVHTVIDNQNPLVSDIGLGQPGSGTNGISFRFLATKIQGVCSNAAGISTVDLFSGLGPGYNLTKTYEFRFTATGSVDFYVDDVLKGSLALNIPAGTGYATLLFLFKIQSDSAKSHSFKTSSFKFTQAA